MKCLLDVPNEVWADVKHYATIRKMTYVQAANELLKKALIKEGYSY